MYDSRTVTPGSASGNKIGVARLYNLKLKNAEYINATTQYECSLYDIQTYTTITLNTSLSKPSSTFIEGKNSSASGYLVSDVVNSNLLTQRKIIYPLLWRLLFALWYQGFPLFLFFKFIVII